MWAGVKRGVLASILLCLVVYLAYASSTVDSGGFRLFIADESDIAVSIENTTHLYYARYTNISGGNVINSTQILCNVTVNDTVYSMSFLDNDTSPNITNAFFGEGFYFIGTQPTVNFTTYNVTCAQNGSGYPTINATDNMSVFNARLSISDSESGNDSIYVTTGQVINFTANYTDVFNVSLQNSTNVSCNISFSDVNVTMFYNMSSSVYEYNRTFSSAGSYTYNVSCIDLSTTYSNRTLETTFVVTENRPFFNETYTSANSDLVNYLSGRIMFAEINESNSNLEFFGIGADASGDPTFDYYVTDTNITKVDYSWMSSLHLENSVIGVADLGLDGEYVYVGSGRDSGAVFNVTLLSSEDGQLYNNSGLSAVEIATLGIYGGRYFSTEIYLIGQDVSTNRLSESVFFANNITSLSTQITGILNYSEPILSYIYLTNDSSIDIVVGGSNASGGEELYGYEGTSLNYSYLQNLTSVRRGLLGCADFRNIGIPDCVIIGNNTNAPELIGQYWQNSGNGTLTRNYSKNFTGLENGGMQVIDINNDGWLDIVYNGHSTLVENVYVYINNQTSFYNATWFSQPTGKFGITTSVAAADYDLDGDVDIAVAGFNSSSASYTAIWTSNYSIINKNLPPTAPGSLTVDYVGGNLIVNWTNGSDDKTPSTGLSYNLRIGTTPGGNEIISGKMPLSSTDPASFFGNMKQRRSLNISAPEQVYYVQVQSIDSSLRLSNWSSTAIFNETCEFTDGNLLINGSICTLLSDLTIPENGNITVLGNGQLILKDMTLDVNNSGDNLSYLVNYGNLTIINSTIMNSFNFTINNSGILRIEESDVSSSNLRVLNTTRVNQSTLDLVYLFTNDTTLANSTIGDLRIFSDVNTSNVTVSSYILPVNYTWNVFAYLPVTTTPGLVNCVIDTDTVVSDSSGDAYMLLLLETRQNSSGSLNTSYPVNYTLNVSKNQYISQSLNFNFSINSSISVTLTSFPDWSEFENSNSTNVTSLAANGTLSNVSNFTLYTQFGFIRFQSLVNLTSLNISDSVDIANGTIANNATALNVTANLTFIGLNFTTTPVILRNGVVCGGQCTNISYGDNEYNVTVSGFSNYTLTNNSLLNISATTSYHKFAENQTITFSANFTNRTSNQSITGATCLLSISGNVTNQSMVFNSGLYTYQGNVTAGMTMYNVACNASGYEVMTVSANITVYDDQPQFLRNGTSYVGLVDSSVFIWNDTLYFTGEDENASLSMNALLVNGLSSAVSILSSFSGGYVASTDFGNDMRQDLLLKSTGTKISSGELQWYDFSDSSVFSLTDINSTGYGSITVADFDNDSDLDFVVGSGDSPDELNSCTNFFTYQVSNNQSNFTVEQIIYPSLCRASLLAIDVNEDGWTDIIITGKNSSNSPQSAVLTNNNGTLAINSSYDLPQVFNSILTPLRINSTHSGFLFTGRNSSNEILANIYTIENGNITLLQNITPVYTGTALPGDINADGYQDLVVTGKKTISVGSADSFVYTNNGSGFVLNSSVSILNYSRGSGILYDFDNDSDLDIFITGANDANTELTHLYTSDLSEYQTNLRPNNNNISFNYSNGTIIMNWSQGSDNLTPNNLLTYNLRLGNSTNNHTFISGIPTRTSNPTTGFFGNMDNRTSIQLDNMPNICYYYSVQVYDASMLTSDWIGANYSTSESCDAYDNDCDGNIDEDWDADGDGVPSVAFSGICTGYSTYDNCDTDAGTLGSCAVSDSGGGGGGSSGGGGGSIGGDTGGIETFDNTEGIGGETEGSSGGNEQEQETTPPPETGGSKTVEKIFANTFGQFEHKRTIEITGRRTQITETVRNKDFFPLEDVFVTIDIPKSIIPNTDYIKEITDFEIIRYDPIIQFYLGDIGPFETKEYRYTIIEEVEDFNITPIINYKNITEEEQEEREQELEEAIDQTAEVLNLEKEINIGEDEVTFNIKLEFQENETILYNVSIFEEIPKCLLEIINEEIAESDKEFEIINEDPLIVWHFDQLLKGEEIQLKIKAIADADCVNKGETIALAKDIIAVKSSKEDLNIIPPLVVIFVLVAIFAAVAQFTKDKYHADHQVQMLIHKAKRMLRKGKKLHEIDKLLEEQGESSETIAAVTNALKHPVRQFFIKTATGLETLILFLLIILNVFDFFKSFNLLADLLNTDIGAGDIDFIKKIISWILLGLLFHHISISRVLFGRTRLWIDIVLLISYFGLTLKNFVGFAKQTFLETIFARDLYVYIINNNAQFETISFFIGIVGILLVATAKSFHHIHRDSLFHALFHSRSWMFFKVLFVLFLFFVIVFNLMFEWLAIAVDAPILVTGLIITLFLTIYYKLRRHYKTTTVEFIEQVAETPDHFYEKILELFHHPKFLPLGLAGMFVLHLVTEIGIYVIPYAFGIFDPVYVDIHDPSHTSIFGLGVSRFIQSAGGLEFLAQAQFAFAYAANLISLLILLLIPLWVWYYMYKHKHKPLFSFSIFHMFIRHDNKGMEITAKIMLLLLAPLLFIAVLKPAFLFKPISDGLLAGVDILTQELSISGINLLLIIAIIGVIALAILMREHMIPLTACLLLISFVSVVAYDVLYVLSMYGYITSLFQFLFDWSTLWLIIRNITIIFTIILGLFSLLGIYGMSAGLLLFMYLPTSWKHVLHDKFLPHHIAQAQHHHHIHFHHLHDHHIHGDKLEHVKKHIETQLQHGHELFIIVERLHDHDWPWEIIEQAVKDLDGSKAFEEDMKHIKHIHHDQPHVKKLVLWFTKHYKSGVHISQLVEQAIKTGWPEDDVALALKQVKLKHDDRELVKYMENVK